MGTPRTVITSIATLNPLGHSLAEVGKHLIAGVPPVAVKDFEFHQFDKPVNTYKITGYDPAVILGKGGLRLKDWSTKITLGALECGMKETLSSFSDDSRPGLCIGTAFGSVQSIGDFLSDSIVNGVNSVNPQLFANTVINSPTGNANIRYGIRSLSSTVATGFNAGMDAIIYSRDLMLRGYLHAIITGGVEEVSYYSLLGMQRAGALSPTGSIRPFATDSDGTVMGEAAVFFLMESMDSATMRGAKPLAEIAGTAMVFDPSHRAGFNPAGEGARRAMRDACAMAGVTPGDIGFIAASANGNPGMDAMEAAAIRAVFNNTPVTAYKGKTGECQGASGPLNILCALADLNTATITGTPSTGYATIAGVNLMNGVTARRVGHVLVNAFSHDGNCSCIVLKNLN